MRKQVLTLLGTHTQALQARTPFARALTAVWLFDWLDKLRLEHFPADWYERLGKGLTNVQTIAAAMRDSFEWSLNTFDGWTDNPETSFERRTGRVYYDLWKNFGPDEYFGRAGSMLRERFDKNGVGVQDVRHALDDGCGSGRYTVALQYLGCERVTGVDISGESVDFARQMNPCPDKVEFVQGSVLDLPFDDATFDFVFSNGVLHHTASTEKGLREIRRVLQPGGRCWLYLYGGKESLFWDIVDCCRTLLDGVAQSYTEALMKVLGYPSGRIFHRLDFFYVPVHRRYFAAEVETMLRDAGFTTFHRLLRGTGHDWDEIRHGNPHLHPYIYGEGEMRYWIEG